MKLRSDIIEPYLLFSRLADYPTLPIDNGVQPKEFGMGYKKNQRKARKQKWQTNNYKK